MFIHATFGMVIFALTVGGPIIAWIRKKETTGHALSFNTWPSLIENVATFTAWCLCICGMVAYFYRRFGKYEWNTKLALKLVEAHRWFGRIFVVGIQGLVMFAIIDNFGFNTTWIVVSFAQFFALASVFAILEIRHRYISS